jgi:hypothetical protein
MARMLRERDVEELEKQAELAGRRQKAVAALAAGRSGEGLSRLGEQARLDAEAERFGRAHERFMERHMAHVRSSPMSHSPQERASMLEFYAQKRQERADRQARDHAVELAEIDQRKARDAGRGAVEAQVAGQARIAQEDFERKYGHTPFGEANKNWLEDEAAKRQAEIEKSRVAGALVAEHQSSASKYVADRNLEIEKDRNNVTAGIEKARLKGSIQLEKIKSAGALDVAKVQAEAQKAAAEAAEARLAALQEGKLEIESLRAQAKGMTSEDLILVQKLMKENPDKYEGMSPYEVLRAAKGLN